MLLFAPVWLAKVNAHSISYPRRNDARGHEFRTHGLSPLAWVAAWVNKATSVDWRPSEPGVVGIAVDERAVGSGGWACGWGMWFGIGGVTLDTGERLLRGSIDIKFSFGSSNANQATEIQFVFSFLRHARNRVYAKQIGYLATTTWLGCDMHLFDQLFYP